MNGGTLRHGANPIDEIGQLCFSPDSRAVDIYLLKGCEREGVGGSDGHAVSVHSYTYQSTVACTVFVVIRVHRHFVYGFMKRAIHDSMANTITS